MKTKLMLQAATLADAEVAVKVARERQWTDALIAKHGNAFVQQVLGAPSPKNAKVNAPVAAYIASPAKGKRTAKGRKAKKAKVRVRRPEVTEFAGAKRVSLSPHAGGKDLVGKLEFTFPRDVLTGPRKGQAKTHDCRITLANGRTEKPFTLSEAAMQRFLAGQGTRVWVNEKAHVVKPLS